MKHEVSTPVVALIVVVALAIVGWLAWKYVFAGPQSTMIAATPAVKKQYMELHAKSAAQVRQEQQKLLEAHRANPTGQ